NKISSIPQRRINIQRRLRDEEIFFESIQKEMLRRMSRPIRNLSPNNEIQPEMKIIYQYRDGFNPRIAKSEQS
ncbi:hypothetical protein HK096_000143, partial [Nowakowskiella sp. JEL0078]